MEQEKRKVSNFDILKVLSQSTTEGDLVMYPPSNIKRARTGKDGWGEVTMAVANADILSREHRFVLYAFNMERFEEVKKEMEDHK
jgi:hypothetical protein